MTVSKLIQTAAPVIVLGDVMLDIYLSGTVSRISPEAPVPVLRHVAEEDRIGGAANVALNIATVGGRAHLIGVIGQDGEGARLQGVLQSAGVGTDLVRCDSRATITKTRIMAGKRHQFLRIDREETGRFPEAIEADILLRLAAALDRGAGALVLSDYAKGCLSDRILGQAMALARDRGVPVLVDPKRTDFAAYGGADYIKPNMAELAAAAGIAGAPAEAVMARAATLACELDVNILLTMSERGMALFPRDGGEPMLMPTLAREVFDVSGAGDTVMALFAAALAGGATLRQAMHVANVAAGLVVSKVGTATLTAAELATELAEEDDRASAQAHQGPLGWAAARALREKWRDSGLDVGFTNGCFDLLHPGHIRILTGARAVCDRLIVALNTDASVARLKGPGRPVQDEASRAEVIGALQAVDAVVLFDQDTPLELIRFLQPDALIKGADYTEDQIVGADVVRALGGRVERVTLREGHSTTRLIARSTSGVGVAAAAPSSASGADLAGADLDGADLAGAATAWLNGAALPLWLEHGLDRTRGGFCESLTQDRLESTADFRRLRVVTRQIYAFAAALRLGHGAARAGLMHGLDFLLGPARHPGGGFANRFDLDGRVIDETRDLYDLAFVLFALAHAHDVTGDAALRDEARALAGFIGTAMRHPDGGFREALPDRAPRRQNPHMHLLEAALAWTALDPDGPVTDLARDLGGVFRTRLFQPATGTLPEYFDAALAPLPGPEGRITEPGHHFEWVWLLHHATRLGVLPAGPEAEALYRFARAHGIAPDSGLPRGEVAPDGTVLTADTRLWTATEWLKAEAVVPGADRGARMAAAWRGITRFLDTPRPGLWHERWNAATQSFVPGPAPATSFYHLVLAIEVLCETAGAHPRPFAGRSA